MNIEKTVLDGTHVWHVGDSFPDEEMEGLRTKMRDAFPGKNGILIKGDIRLVAESVMNDLGWYRKPQE